MKTKKTMTELVRTFFYYVLLASSLLLPAGAVFGQEGGTLYLPVVSGSGGPSVEATIDPGDPADPAATADPGNPADPAATANPGDPAATVEPVESVPAPGSIAEPTTGPTTGPTAEPATVKRLVVSVTQGADDGEELPDGRAALTGDVLDLGQEHTVGLRFAGLGLPRDARIQRATLILAAEAAQGDPTMLLITGEASGNALPFALEPDSLSQRAKTDATVQWDVPAWNPSVQVHYESPNLAALVQAIVNRDDWSPQNSLALYLDGTGHRKAASYEKATSRGWADHAPRLAIEYTGGQCTGRRIRPAPISSTRVGHPYPNRPARFVTAEQRGRRPAAGGRVPSRHRLVPGGAG